MRISYLSTFFPLRGGIAHFNERFALELQRRGHTVRAITFSRQYPKLLFPGKTQEETGGAAGEQAVKAEVRVDSIGPLSWWRTGRSIRKDAPDVLVFKYWISFFAPCFWAIARLAKGNRRTRVVYLVDNFIPHESRMGEGLLRWLAYRAVDGCVVMSESVERDLRAAHPRLAIERSPHPVYDNFGAALGRDEARQRLGLPANATIALFFGYIRPYKGLDQLIDAFAGMAAAHPDLHLVVAGECYEDEQRYKDQVKASPYADRIHYFSDYIPNDAVAAYFSAADVLVLPYRTATQSGIVQIAYHFERPCIVTDVGGLSEVVLDGRTGYVVRPNDRAALVEGVARFMRDRRDMSAAIREERRKYSWAAFAEALERLVQRLA
ncbi:MAG: glycosyltransferase [Flavobacteriales bacterium]|nr:glycosyltransferase [Flavobacteriales bacterium]